MNAFVSECRSEASRTRARRPLRSAARSASRGLGEAGAPLAGNVESLGIPVGERGGSARRVPAPPPPAIRAASRSARRAAPGSRARHPSGARDARWRPRREPAMTTGGRCTASSPNSNPWSVPSSRASLRCGPKISTGIAAERPDRLDLPVGLQSAEADAFPVRGREDRRVDADRPAQGVREDREPVRPRARRAPSSCPPSCRSRSRRSRAHSCRSTSVPSAPGSSSRPTCRRPDCRPSPDPPRQRRHRERPAARRPDANSAHSIHHLDAHLAARELLDALDEVLHRGRLVDAAAGVGQSKDDRRARAAGLVLAGITADAACRMRPRLRSRRACSAASRFVTPAIVPLLSARIETTVRAARAGHIVAGPRLALWPARTRPLAVRQSGGGAGRRPSGGPRSARRRRSRWRLRPRRARRCARAGRDSRPTPGSPSLLPPLPSSPVSRSWWPASSRRSAGGADGSATWHCLRAISGSRRSGPAGRAGRRSS